MTRLLRLRGPGIAIYALAAFALAAVMLWRGYTLHGERAQRVAAAQATTATAAVYVGNYIARTVDAADLLVDDVREYVSDRGGLSGTPPNELQAHLSARADSTSIDDYLLVVDPRGQVVAFSGDRAPPPTGFAGRAWFRAHSLGGADSFLGPAVKSRLADQVVYTYSEALRAPDGALQGVIVAGVVPTQPKPWSARRPGEPLAQLWTTQGRLITASHMEFAPDGSSVPQSPPFVAPPGGPMGFLATGSRGIVAYSTATGRPLVATVSLPQQEVLAPWRDEVRDSLILLALGGLVLAVLASIAARYADQDYRARLELEQTAGALSAAVGEKDILLREIHHRVKNNLQITSSLIQLQSRAFEDPEVRAAFDQTQQRLRSISLVHDVLYHENTAARVDAAVYLRELTEEIATANGAAERGISVRVEAQSIVLSPGQVTPLGLCLAEVLTNAFKHAFPDGRPGSILVRAREAEGEIELVVRDDGEGFEGEPARKGSLGLMLISVLARQIGGAFSFSSDGGTVFRLTFPRKG